MQKINILLVITITVLFLSCMSTKNVTRINKEANSQYSIADTLSEENQYRFKTLFVEGLKQKILGNSREAVALFSSCLEIDPNSAVSMYELAKIHAGNNDLTSASLLLGKAISINPENKWYKLLLARIYQQTRKFDEAATIYNELSKQDPENLDYLYFNAILLSGAEKFNEAIKIYRNIEKKIGFNEQISVSIQQLLINSGKINAAYNEAQKLIDSNPEESKYYGLLADLYLSQNEREKALKNYQKILEIDPENGFVHFSLANFYEDEDYQKGIKHTKLGFRSTKVDLESKLQVYLMLTSGKAKSKLSQEDNEELIKIILNAHSEDPRVYMIYAEYLIRKNDLSAARIQLKKAISVNNSDYIVWERVLFIDNDLQDWQALYNDSREAIDLFPTQPQAYFFNGIACIQLKKYDETLVVCEEGLDFVVDNPPLEGQFVLLQGEAKYKLGDLKEAFELFDKAIDQDQDNYVALNNYAYYLSLSGENLDKAERMSGKVIERFPDNPTYIDTHAWVLFKKEKYQLAKFYMETAIKNGGDQNSTLLEHYGDILIMLNNSEEAKKYWLKAKEKGSDSVILDKKINDLKYYENKEK